MQFLQPTLYIREYKLYIVVTSLPNSFCAVYPENDCNAHTQKFKLVYCETSIRLCLICIHLNIYFYLFLRLKLQCTSR